MPEQPEFTIRLARPEDDEALWRVLRDVIRAGDSYAIDPGLTRGRALALWTRTPRVTCVAEREGRILGTYYIRTNHPGPGSHVCNCGYMVAPGARRQGVARAMCRHSQDAARRLGYLAMQFNLVVATNHAAVRLWQDLGFEIVGRLPRAFRHPDEGLVDALVMYLWLAPDDAAD